jgi:2-hydroxychromene-2-carboxylate isomerase
VPSFTRFDVDKLTSMDDDYPNDPNVPELPPVPDAVNPPPPRDNWNWTRFNDDVHPQENPYAPPLTAVVTEENPLKADVCWSMRSPYSYLTLSRLVYLNSNYNVDVSVRLIVPVAVRTRASSGKAGSGRWYKWADTINDTRRVGQHQGIPYRFANPDPIWQNTWPTTGGADFAVHPLEKQPYISWVIRLGNYAELQGKGIDYVAAVSPLIWGGHVDHWPDHVKGAFNSIDGLDYDTAIKFIRDHPEKVDAVWQENQNIQMNAGHGGVPLMIFQGEPFFGQDRFDVFYWRLRQNGLTKRRKPRAPFIEMPLRFPVNQ